LLSDMRTVRPQGRTFRITQPHGLRVSYLRATQGHCKGRDKILSRCLHATIQDNNVRICYSKQTVIFKFLLISESFAIITTVILMGCCEGAAEVSATAGAKRRRTRGPDGRSRFRMRGHFPTANSLPIRPTITTSGVTRLGHWANNFALLKPLKLYRFCTGDHYAKRKSITDDRRSAHGPAKSG
jgi:hypothetical protein